jgi:hypothetical protein
MFVKRTSVLGAAFLSILFIGCDGGAPHLGSGPPDLRSLPDGDPAQLEPGYVSGPVTSTSPAIEIRSSGGIVGGGWGNLHIWEDGTVLFDGAGCPNANVRRGKMSPARVRAVIDKLEAAHFFVWPRAGASPCRDSFITSLTVRRGRASNTLVDPGCRSDAPFATKAIELVMKAVGKNACSPSCRATPAPASCN